MVRCRAQTNCWKSIAARSHSTTPNQVTTILRSDCRIRSPSLLDSRRGSIKQCTRGYLLSLWLFRRDLTRAKQAPIDPRFYTAEVAGSNPAEPLFFYQSATLKSSIETFSLARIMTKDKHNKDKNCTTLRIKIAQLSQARSDVARDD